LKSPHQSSQLTFHEPTHQGLTLPEEVEPQLWSNHLAYRSAREPENLLNHVRRIYLHLETCQTEELYGAMLDLFLVLGDRGGALRKRLLKKAKNRLPRHTFEMFVKNLKQGLRKNQPYPTSPYSVLGNFFEGGLSLFDEADPSDTESGKSADPLELAQEELTFGDISVAQEILEKAINASPERMGLHFGLLEIYKHTRSLDDLMRMQQQLGEHTNIAQSAWKKTRQYLESQG
jgi:tetratricopeptide (TPR) repeat protein